MLFSSFAVAFMILNIVVLLGLDRFFVDYPAGSTEYHRFMYLGIFLFKFALLYPFAVLILGVLYESITGKESDFFLCLVATSFAVFAFSLEYFAYYFLEMFLRAVFIDPGAFMEPRILPGFAAFILFIAAVLFTAYQIRKSTAFDSAHGDSTHLLNLTGEQPSPRPRSRRMGGPGRTPGRW